MLTEWPLLLTNTDFDFPLRSTARQSIYICPQGFLCLSSFIGSFRVVDTICHRGCHWRISRAEESQAQDSRVRRFLQWEWGGVQSQSAALLHPVQDITDDYTSLRAACWAFSHHGAPYQIHIFSKPWHMTMLICFHQALEKCNAKFFKKLLKQECFSDENKARFVLKLFSKNFNKLFRILVSIDLVTVDVRLIGK